MQTGSTVRTITPESEAFEFLSCSIKFRSRAGLQFGVAGLATEFAMDVAEWLSGLGLGQYATAFVAEGVDLSVLSTLSDQDLKDLGIATLGHRRKILLAAALDGGPVPACCDNIGRRVRRNDLVIAQSGHECRCFPMAMGHVVNQPCAFFAASRSRVICVLVLVSSTKTSFSGSSVGCAFRHSSRAATASARSCSLACRVFF